MALLCLHTAINAFVLVCCAYTSITKCNSIPTSYKVLREICVEHMFEFNSGGVCSFFKYSGVVVQLVIVITRSQSQSILGFIVCFFLPLFWCAYMVINVCVQHNNGFLLDIILLTRC